ncbi:MAG TPA: hypothetical protein PKJ41_13885 [Bryobacteraceae bacterium]|nr:hypothetical protein [Bryobacteraceae bacterium]
MTMALLTYLLPVAWWALIARLIYDEPLAVEQPFWVTRPYSRKSLLAAKVLFIVVFVNLPKLIGDALILLAYGFQIGPELGGLLWSQVLLMVLFALPVVALCVVTTGFVQLLIAIFALGLAAAGWNLAASELGANVPWLALEWTRFCCMGVVVAAAALAIIAWQYARRDTARSRLITGGAVLLVLLVYMFLPWTAAFALQSRLSSQAIDVSTIRIGFDEGLKWGARALVNSGGDVELQVPLRITGLTDQLILKPEGISATIEGPGGESWRADGPPPSHLRSVGDLISLHANVNSTFYQKVKDQPVRVRGSVYITLYGNPRRTIIPIEDRATFHPTAGVGVCSAVRSNRHVILTCRSALKSRADLVTFEFIGKHRFVAGALPSSFRTISFASPISYSPFPAEAGLVPVTQYVSLAEVPKGVGDEREVRAFALEPVAHIKKDFEIAELRLTEFEVDDALPPSAPPRPRKAPVKAPRGPLR